MWNYVTMAVYSLNIFFIVCLLFHFIDCVDENDFNNVAYIFKVKFMTVKIGNTG